MRQLSLFNKEQPERVMRLQVDDNERERLKKKGLNWKEQMIAAKWPRTMKALVGFLGAQTSKEGDELDQLHWQLAEIATEILGNG